MNRFALGLLLVFSAWTAALPEEANAMTCEDGFRPRAQRAVPKDVEVSTFQQVGTDLMGLLGNDALKRKLSELTAKKGFRLQVANITGQLGRAQAHFSRVIEANSNGVIELQDFDSAIAEAAQKANASGEPILNTSILVSRDEEPEVSQEDRHYADQIYDYMFERIMIDNQLTRQQLLSMQAGLRGKVWYFVAQSLSRPEVPVVIYDPSKR